MSAKYVYIHCAECGRNRRHHAHGLCSQCYQHQYHRDNKEYRLECRRLRHAANREEDNERSRQWARDNPDKHREYSHRRRARENGATIGLVDEAAVFERDGMCMYCGATHKKLTIDHIMALSNGGPHSEDNTMAACGYCNRSKGTKPLAEWLQIQPYSIAWLF